MTCEWVRLLRGTVLSEDTVATFTSRNCGKLRKLSMKMNGSLSEIRAGYLSDKNAIMLTRQ
jgi:hypothetical protein